MMIIGIYNKGRIIRGYNPVALGFSTRDYLKGKVYTPGMKKHNIKRCLHGQYLMTNKY